ncbi:MAG: type I-C CRISPR-associated protein Cas7/Csd2 [Clostridiaceae bacterium]|jgi:CRISPR-associated protein Csd2|nr:type I-C CRISPR-associated protein Cas7/Csd2 [Clostridiaceae bacterium]
MLDKKIDFVAIISVKNANPNGDPLNGNRPREDIRGYGEISDVALKRKIRNRLMDIGESVFVQSDERNTDGYDSLSTRAASTIKKYESRDDYANQACEKWIDVRSFGQVFAFKKRKIDGVEIKEVSVGVRGPVTIHPAFSVEPIAIEDIQITKSVNSEPSDKGKSSDTMGMKHRVNFGLYVTKGSINCQLAEKTGFSKEDADKIHDALKTLFENDASAARPEGSVNLEKLYWFEHGSKLGDYPTLKVHESIQVSRKEDIQEANSIDDYEINVVPLEGLEPDVYSLR